MKIYSREGSFFFSIQSECKGLFPMNEKEKRIICYDSEVRSKIPASVAGNLIPFT